MDWVVVTGVFPIRFIRLSPTNKVIYGFAPTPRDWRRWLIGMYLLRWWLPCRMNMNHCIMRYVPCAKTNWVICGLAWKMVCFVCMMPIKLIKDTWPKAASFLLPVLPCWELFILLFRIRKESSGLQQKETDLSVPSRLLPTECLINWPVIFIVKRICTVWAIIMCIVSMKIIMVVFG